mmetsp:Transcript_6687/g.10223  ORF Transcript_6687/g.10223 Transcript_6687/m.10223 type:complete len:283 (+) Transcript_6687:58-906(+)
MKRKTSGQETVEDLIATSTSPEIKVAPVHASRKTLSREIKSGKSTLNAEQRKHLSELEFKKEEVPASMSPRGLDPTYGATSALTSMLEKTTNSDLIDDSLVVEEDMGSRFRTRTRSCHASNPDRAVQAAAAFNISMASREHQNQAGVIYSPGSRDSSSFYIGSTPNTSSTTYDPYKPGKFQLTNKFRCTVHLQEVLPLCQKHARQIRVNSETKGSDTRTRATSANNPSSMVGLSSCSFVQLKVAHDHTAEYIVWKSIKSYLQIMGSNPEAVVKKMREEHGNN